MISSFARFLGLQEAVFQKLLLFSLPILATVRKPKLDFGHFAINDLILLLCFDIQFFFFNNYRYIQEPKYGSIEIFYWKLNAEEWRRRLLKLLLTITNQYLPFFSSCRNTPCYKVIWKFL